MSSVSASASSTGEHFSGVAVTATGAPAAYTVPADVLAVYRVVTAVVCLDSAAPVRVVTPDPADASVVAVSAFLVKATVSPLTGWPLAVSTTVARSGNAAPVHTEAVAPV